MKVKLIAISILALGISAYMLKDNFNLGATGKYYSEETQLYLPKDLEATL